MKTAAWIRTSVSLLIVASAGAGAAAAQAEVLLFRDGRVLVRQSLPIRIPAGRSVQRLSLDQHDPSSLMVLDSGLVLVEALYPHTIDLTSLYQRILGRRLIFRRPPAGDTVSAVVIGTDPLRFGLPWGVSLTPPGDPLFPADLLGPGRTVEATFESAHPLDRLHLAYVTSGASWTAEYSMVIQGDGATVSGTASLRSSALATDSAEITLLDGMVNRTAPFARQQTEDRDQYALAQLAGAAVSLRGAVLSAVAEVHLYQIPGRSVGHRSLADQNPATVW